MVERCWNRQPHTKQRSMLREQIPLLGQRPPTGESHEQHIFNPTWMHSSTSSQRSFQNMWLCHSGWGLHRCNPCVRPMLPRPHRNEAEIRWCKIKAWSRDWGAFFCPACCLYLAVNICKHHQSINFLWLPGQIWSNGLVWGKMYTGFSKGFPRMGWYFLTAHFCPKIPAVQGLRGVGKQLPVATPGLDWWNGFRFQFACRWESLRRSLDCWSIPCNIIQLTSSWNHNSLQMSPCF